MNVHSKPFLFSGSIPWSDSSSIRWIISPCLVFQSPIFLILSSIVCILGLFALVLLGSSCQDLFLTLIVIVNGTFILDGTHIHHERLGLETSFYDFLPEILLLSLDCLFVHNFYDDIYNIGIIPSDQFLDNRWWFILTAFKFHAIFVFVNEEILLNFLKNFSGISSYLTSS